jgi:beta-alanine degradation protein BauB
MKGGRLARSSLERYPRAGGNPMTTRRPFRRWLPLFTVLNLILAVSVLSAQDAEKVSPKVVHLKLENEKVRVLETVSNPGDKEGMHSHPQSVVYVIAGGKLRITTPDGKTSDVEFKTGDTIWREPVIHAAENIGTTQVHAIIFELRPPARGRQPD